MKAQDRNKAWGFTLFGDDVRVELGNKISLMGLYQSDMLFPMSLKLPFAMSKFVLQIMYYEMLGAIESDFSFKVTYGPNDHDIAEVPVLRKNLATSAVPVGEEDPEGSERIIHLRIPLVLAPFQVSEMGRIRVRARYSDGAVLKLGSIGLKQLVDAEFQSVTGMIPPTPSL